MTARRASAGRRPVGRPPGSLLAACAVLAALGLSVGPAARADSPQHVAEQLRCLALTIYFEARGEPDAGKLAVGHVVMNRVASETYPDKVCAVVRQGGEDELHRCQFSWWCDGRSDQPTEIGAWRRSQALARVVYWDRRPDPTGGARWYHAEHVQPGWRDSFVQGPQIGNHLFYLPAERAIRHGGTEPGPQLAERPGAGN